MFGEEAGEVVVRPAVAGADQGYLRVAGVAEQLVAAARILRLGGELVRVFGGIAGAAQLPGDLVQGAVLAHAASHLADVLALRDALVDRQPLDRLGHQPGCAIRAVWSPVLVAAEVEGMLLMLAGQPRKIRHDEPHPLEAAEHGLVVGQCPLIVEAGHLRGVELVAVHQAAGRLIDQYQFDALALEGIVQALQPTVAGRRGFEFGAQVFAGAEKPVALGLHQGDEVLLVIGGVPAGVVCRRAQAATGRCPIDRTFRLYGAGD
ncbi:hypothetical protein D9M68_673290 [compost metagenome]